jgi:nitronate monooxygenase
MAKFTLNTLRYPIVQAPMGGGPSTPELAAAVSTSGGLGFLAAGYKSLEALRGDVEAVRSRLSAQASFGVNVFAPPGPPADPADVARYGQRLRGEAERTGVPLGEPRWDDDRYEDKLEFLCVEPVPVVSFTFGCPTADDVGRLQRAGSAVWITVTSAQEASVASDAGADALVVQGVEAGGHRGGFDDSSPGEIGLLALLQLVKDVVGERLPLVATGGLATGRAIAAVLAAGAAAAQLGTAFMLCPEAGTAPSHREALADHRATTALTRAFTGRMARGIANRFLLEHSADAPSAYPEIHHLTSALRTAARAHGDRDGFHIWAGQAYPLAQPVPAEVVVARLGEEARVTLARAAKRFE